MIIILGHEGCGAVKEAQKSFEEISGNSPGLQDMLSKIKLKLDSDKLNCIHDR